MADSDNQNRVKLRVLMNSCMSLASQACNIIRSLQREREASSGMGGERALCAQLKDPNDSRSYLTVADELAQAHIISGLRALDFGAGLSIVGEEDPTSEVSTSSHHLDQAGMPPDHTLEPGYQLPVELEELVLSEITIFVDPGNLAVVCRRQRGWVACQRFSSLKECKMEKEREENGERERERERERSRNLANGTN